jgi:hypothetical protein
MDPATKSRANVVMGFVNQRFSNRRHFMEPVNINKRGMILLLRAGPVTVSYINLKHIVPYILKARTVNPAEIAVARERI